MSGEFFKDIETFQGFNVPPMDDERLKKLAESFNTGHRECPGSLDARWCGLHHDCADCLFATDLNDRRIHARKLVAFRDYMHSRGYRLLRGR